jgi:demethoxyubiquinone hydroxylase (CLK1/Coq7/Cat5 family)
MQTVAKIITLKQMKYEEARHHDNAKSSHSSTADLKDTEMSIMSDKVFNSIASKK